MKTSSKLRILLGFVMFLLELGTFILTASILRVSTKELALLAALYFLLLVFQNHFHFASVLIWHAVVELLQIHLLYLGVCCILTIYLNADLWMHISVITVVMFFVTITVNRFFRILSLKKAGIQVLVLGAGEEAENMHILFNRNRFLYINPVAYVSTESIIGTKNSELITQTAKIIALDEIDAFLKTHTLDEVYIVDDLLPTDKLEAITNVLRQKVPVIRYKSEIKTLLPYNMDIADFDESLFTVLADKHNHYFGMALRKILDIFVGIVGCLVLIPVTLFVKLGYLKDGDKAPIFFKQDRFGKDGKLIKIYKFRTMVPNAEQLLEEMMAKDPKIREEYLTNKKLNPDPRITPFGNLLRRTSLDELPQQINILKGEMSLIGPRPYLPREKEDMGSCYETIIKFKPGLTGIWQASGRNNISFSERCKLDEFYYYNWSIWLDIIILVKTVKSVFLKDGAI